MTKRLTTGGVSQATQSIVAAQTGHNGFALDKALYFRAMEKQATEPQRASADETHGESLGTGDVRLAWGNPTRWKAQWREEALRQHLDLPVGERLRRALSLLVKRSEP